jgi:hypothetical protein
LWGTIIFIIWNVGWNKKLVGEGSGDHRKAGFPKNKFCDKSAEKC